MGLCLFSSVNTQITPMTRQTHTDTDAAVHIQMHVHMQQSCSVCLLVLHHVQSCASTETERCLRSEHHRGVCVPVLISWHLNSGVETGRPLLLLDMTSDTSAPRPVVCSVQDPGRSSSYRAALTGEDRVRRKPGA